MKKYIPFLIAPSLVLAGPIPPAPLPVFLKAGFSSILEFTEAPTKVVLGDSQSFQVERIERSLVLKTLAPYAASNMFVYFKSEEPRLFILTASEDAQPTYYKKFEPPAYHVPDTQQVHNPRLASLKLGAQLVYAKFDSLKDYLTVETELTADSKEVLKPRWNLVRLSSAQTPITPYKLWAEREDVQKDSKVRFRCIFAKPNIPRDLSGVTLIVPILGHTSPMIINLGEPKR